YFRQTVWLGHSAQEGFGCDNTTGPSTMVQTDAVLLPAQAPTSASAPFAWLGYDGHWGQKENGPNTGPPGPNAKDQWPSPDSWSAEEWRGSSLRAPLQSPFGPGTPAFFCGAVAAGSKLYLRFLRTPWLALGAFVLIGMLGVWLSRGPVWSSPEPLPIDELRS